MSVLQRQEAEIPLNGGMDTSAGAEYQAVTTMRNVLDLRWNNDGELEKRPATASTQAIVSPGSVGVYAGLGGAGLIESRGEVYTITNNYGAMNESGRYASAGGSNISLGSVPWPVTMLPKLARVSRLDIDKVSGSEADQGFQSYAACTYASTTLVTAAVVYSSSTAASGCTLRLQALDIETGAVIAQMQYDNDAVGATSWAVDACENTDATTPGAVVTFSSGSGSPYTIYKYRYRAGTKDFVSDGAIQTNAKTVKHRIKTSPTDGYMYIAYETGSNLLYAEHTSCTTNVLTASHVGTHTANGGVDIVISGSKVCIISAASGAAAAVYAERFGTPATAVTLWTTGATETVYSLTGARQTASSNTDHAVLFLTVADNPGGVAPLHVKTISALVDFSATTVAQIGSNAVSYDNTCAIARAVTHDDRAYVLSCPSYSQSELPTPCWLRHEQPYITLSGFQRPVARVLDDVFAMTAQIPGYTTNLYSAFVVGDKVYAACPTSLSADSMPGPASRVGQAVSLACVDLAVAPCTYAKKDGVACAGTGVPFELDGDVATIVQPYCRPVVVVDTATAGTTTVATSCYVIAIYTWIDAANRLHRSEPSLAVSTGTFTTQQLDVYVSEMPYAPFTDTAGRQYSVELYITADGGTTYYRANAAGGSVQTLFSSGEGYRVYSDVQLGAAGNSPLYSSGTSAEELTSEAPPAFQAICTVGDRMFAVDAEDRSRVWFTKPFEAGYAPEWNTDNTLFLGDDGVGISDVGGVPTVFCKRGIWQIYGEGPSALGLGSFDPARRLPHEVACLDALSVCKTPMGVAFRARQGVMLLDNGLALQPIGSAIASLYVSGTPTGYCKITYDELSDELHVLDFDTKHFVFNMGEQKWSQWTQDSAFQNWADCVTVDGRVWFLQRGSSVTDSLCRAKAIDESSHNTHVYGWTLETPWIRFDGVTGDMRIWETLPQIRLGSAVANTGTITCTYETRDNLTDTFTFSAADIIALGSAGQTKNLRCRIRNQRTRQFRMTITEGVPGAATAGHVPVGMRVLYGTTPGGQRTKSTTQNKGST